MSELVYLPGLLATYRVMISYLRVVASPKSTYHMHREARKADVSDSIGQESENYAKNQQMYAWGAAAISRSPEKLELVLRGALAKA